MTFDMIPRMKVGPFDEPKADVVSAIKKGSHLVVSFPVTGRCKNFEPTRHECRFSWLVKRDGQTEIEEHSLPLGADDKAEMVVAEDGRFQISVTKITTSADKRKTKSESVPELDIIATKLVGGGLLGFRVAPTLKHGEAADFAPALRFDNQCTVRVIKPEAPLVGSDGPWVVSDGPLIGHLAHFDLQAHSVFARVRLDFKIRETDTDPAEAAFASWESDPALEHTWAANAPRDQVSWVIGFCNGGHSQFALVGDEEMGGFEFGWEIWGIPPSGGSVLLVSEPKAIVVPKLDLQDFRIEQDEADPERWHVSGEIVNVSPDAHLDVEIAVLTSESEGVPTSPHRFVRTRLDNHGHFRAELHIEKMGGQCEAAPVEPSPEDQLVSSFRDQKSSAPQDKTAVHVDAAKTVSGVPADLARLDTVPVGAAGVPAALARPDAVPAGAGVPADLARPDAASAGAGVPAALARPMDDPAPKPTKPGPFAILRFPACETADKYGPISAYLSFKDSDHVLFNGSLTLDPAAPWVTSVEAIRGRERPKKEAGKRRHSRPAHPPFPPDHGVQTDPIRFEDLWTDLTAWEGVIPHMYKDTRGYITVAAGNLLQRFEKKSGVDPDNLAVRQHPFQNLDANRLARADELGREWDRVSKLPAAMPWQEYAGHPYIGLTDDYMKDLAKRRLENEFWTALPNMYTGWDEFPLAAKRGITEMAYALGPAKLQSEFGDFNAAVGAKQWAIAANCCHIKGGRETRNEWRKQLFLYAAKVTSPSKP